MESHFDYDSYCYYSSSSCCCDYYFYGISSYVLYEGIAARCCKSREREEGLGT